VSRRGPRALLLEELADVHQFVLQLDEAQWHTPSLCDDWTVMEVAAHLASFVGVSVMGLGTRMARGGFSPARANSKGVSEWCKRGRSAIIEALSPTPVPGIAKVYARVGLTEVVIHHQDMRRPLGRPRAVPQERLRVALTVAARWPMGTGGNRRRRHVELRATDLDWSAGSGPQVSGPAEALLMALAGRRSVIAELQGGGLGIFSGMAE
jgi:uncharacterized protein (TIGR03083 family)